MTKIRHNIKKVLIANRGEIALRIIRTLREMGIRSVAIYSEADARSLHVKMADESVALSGVLSKDTYLNIPKIIEAAKLTQSDAIHPGFGFLSENSNFVAEVEKQGIIFIGPTQDSMLRMGDKIQAKNLMIAAGVPVVPGSREPLDEKKLKSFVKEHGYPVILKAAAGGGGRGMRVVRQDQDLTPSLEACQREALNYFGNDQVFVERYIEQPRHIEFQVLGDGQGHVVHLFERDCSVQRRHQKLFEEAPSSYLNDSQRKKLGEIAVMAAKSVNYRGAGTIEMICESPEKVYFMEMNTRIQVEHPVTEMITGVDLIHEQICIARGEPLRFKQEDIRIKGWAMEARINAEDPCKGFMPTPGRIKNLHLPHGPFTRLDTHIYEGYEVPEFYDSMICKTIAWAENRSACLSRMERILSELSIDGIATTIPFHLALLQHPKFCDGKITTRFLEEEEKYFQDFYQKNSEMTELEQIASQVISAIQIQNLNSSNIQPAAGYDHFRNRWKNKSQQESVRGDL